MSANSLLSAFSLGVQSNKTTAATTHHTALATVSGMDPEFDVREPPAEHPGPGARTTLRRSPSERTGYIVPVNATFFLRPRFIGRVLRAMGFGVSSVNNTTHFTHTFTLANRTAVAWLTAIHKWSGDTDLERKVIGVRGTQLQMNAGPDELQCTFEGLGLTEGNATGSETKVAEIDTLISTKTGSLSFAIAGNTVTSPIRGNQLTIAQELDREDKVLHQSGRADLPQQSIDLSGTLQGIDIDHNDYEIYRRIKRGGMAATAPTLTAVTGALSFTYESAGNISGAAVPYRLTVAFPTVEYNIVSPNANGRDLIRADVSYAMIDDSATPVTITLVNDQASYA